VRIVLARFAEMSPRNREQSGKPRILIVGGVAGGASCAARARRLSEEAEIIIFERGPYVSFANCGLPYYVGDVIPDENDLLVATPQYFRERFNIDARVDSEVTAIDRQNNEVEVKNIGTGETYREKYDALVLSPGATPIRPPLPGIDLPGVFSLRTIPDSRRIREWIMEHEVKQAVIVGGGFIGLEMAENLSGRGISVSILEMLPQIMPALDPEMAVLVHKHLVNKGVSLHLGDAVTGFEPGADGNIITVITQSGKKHLCDMVILAIGVRPEVKLARGAGLEVGALGGIRVDDRMRTSDDRIWAVGDAVEVRDVITGEWTLLALAGPASRQGRITADVIMGRDARFRGVQATAVCKVFDVVIASTGASEKVLQRSGINGRPVHYEKVYLEPTQHVGYYPGAKPIMVKLIFSTDEGKILGVQAIGEEGVERRIDVISMAIQKGATVFDLEEAELCYAPQFGGAKDPVNMAGMVAANVLRGDSPVVHWNAIPGHSATVLDARTPAEFAVGRFEGAVNIPLDELRGRVEELPRDGEILVYCRQGHRSYYATRILRLNGLNARNVSGGMLVYDMQKQSGTT
jgi:NADPH-dependent 2,4-dienoyl-CoA reductase/sulfur reductase-like enzyme/rhodanese-related sulfurtransferase